jgi:hypothetical protein
MILVSGSQICYGAQFDYSAAPTQIIAGVVRDTDSGQPLAGAEVTVFRAPGSGLQISIFAAIQ